MSFDVGLETKKICEKLGWNVFYLPSIASTSTWAKDSVEKMNGPTLFVTSLQTQGRGRGQNTWENPKANDNLTATFCVPLKTSPGSITSTRVGLALVKALSEAFEIGFALKAPNDIYIGTKKLAGLLLENMQSSPGNTLCVGLGLNILSAPPFATCLMDHKPDFESQDLELFLKLWAKHFLEAVEKKLSSSSHSLLPEECEELLVYLNRFMALSEPFTQVLPDGSLVNSSQTLHWSQL